jgi:heme o synthase
VEIRIVQQAENRRRVRVITPGQFTRGFPHTVRTHLELVKFRLIALVLLTTAVGFRTASDNPLRTPLLLWTLLGTALCAAGAIASNQRMEITADALMKRTRMRPLPAGTISPGHALRFAAFAVGLGLIVLALAVNLLTASLAAVVVAIYLMVYTPLKRRTPWCTPLGAMCGAIPPMMGWTAALGRLGSGAWILGGVLFFWQIPHFLALAWLYREDYARGGFYLLPTVDPSGRCTGVFTVTGTLLLLLCSVALGVSVASGAVYGAGSLLLGGGLLFLGLRLWRDRSDQNARRLILGCALYLPLLLGLLLVTRL